MNVRIVGRGQLMLAGCLASLLAANGAGAQVPLLRGERKPIIADGRDRYTLLTQRLLNRQVIEQLHADDQAFRLGNRWDDLAMAADASIASQQTWDDQTRFHGFYILDTYSAVRPFPGADANLNLTLFNPSASDGYRVSSDVSAQLGLHLYFDAEPAPGQRVGFDVVGTDLGPTTLGAGLMIEQLPMEGVLASVSYQDFYFRHIFGGRGFWPDDDILIFQVGAFEGLAQVSFLQWQLQSDLPAYLDASVDLPLLGGPLAAGETVDPELLLRPTLRVAAEYAARIRHNRFRHGALLRADALAGVIPGMNGHLGYQFRYYDRGFAPRDDLTPPTTTYNLPLREDYYVTNSIDYFGVSNFYRQWSHTVMAELRVPLGPYFSVVGEGEYVLRFAEDPRSPARVLPIPGGALAPGSWQRFYYRAALQLNPWPKTPHRLSVNLTNKQVHSGGWVNEPVSERFERGAWVVFLAEVFL